jgi:hypothetical protein
MAAGGIFQLFGVKNNEVNNKYKRPTTKMLLDRNKRLNLNGTRRLYHQTSDDIADIIINDQKMLRGSDGLAGGGIYFAETPLDTDHKTLHPGTILECDVKLGKVKTVSYSGEDTCFRKLLWEGYDSVHIPRRGNEYVVYNHDQVENIKKYL